MHGRFGWLVALFCLVEKVEKLDFELWAAQKVGNRFLLLIGAL